MRDLELTLSLRRIVADAIREHGFEVVALVFSDASRQFGVMTYNFEFIPYGSKGNEFEVELNAVVR